MSNLSEALGVLELQPFTCLSNNIMFVYNRYLYTWAGNGEYAENTNYKDYAFLIAEPDKIALVNDPEIKNDIIKWRNHHPFG